MKSFNLKFIFGLLLLVVSIVIPHILACHHGPCCEQYSGSFCPPNCIRRGRGRCTEDNESIWG